MATNEGPVITFGAFFLGSHQTNKAWRMRPSVDNKTRVNLDWEPRGSLHLLECFLLCRRKKRNDNGGLLLYDELAASIMVKFFDKHGTHIGWRLPTEGEFMKKEIGAVCLLCKRRRISPLANYAGVKKHFLLHPIHPLPTPAVTGAGKSTAAAVAAGGPSLSSSPSRSSSSRARPSGGTSSSNSSNPSNRPSLSPAPLLRELDAIQELDALMDDVPQWQSAAGLGALSR
ncbi:hypothetical protein OC835_007563 [Tilletia horrida]|nr:hypothetical protein OC835_007563 [Tilletia horrida]